MDINFSLIKIHDTHFVFDHAEVKGVDVYQGRVDPNCYPAVTLAYSQNKIYNIYALSDKLWLLNEPGQGMQYVVYLNAGADKVYGLLCSEVSTFPQQEGLIVEPLPDCMRWSLTPIQGFLPHDNGVAFLIGSEGLLRWIDYAGRHYG